MRIIILGKPFSGKGTQADLLGKKMNLPTLSMGKILREVHGKDPIGTNTWWEKYTAKGLNVPTEIKFPFLKQILDQSEEGFVLDNFPATLDDLKFLKDYLRESNKKIDHAFYLKVSDQTVEERSRVIRGREDDQPEILHERLEKEFGEDLQPVFDYFKNLEILVEIDGEKSIEDVHQDIMQRLDKLS